jgi:hypothetical protein
LSEEKGKLYTRFEASGPAVLFQHDSSHHTWLPSKGGIQYLILTEDDYSRMIVGSGLFDKETVFSHMTVAKETVLNYGLTLAYYVDNHSIFKFEGYHGPHKSSISQEEGQTQFKRALRSLDIGLIYTGKGKAHAKGKIEKRFDYFQRRLPFECERYHVTDVEEGYKILKDMVDFYNNDRVHAETGEIPARRWEEGIRQGKGRLRPLNADKDLDMIFSLHYERTVKKDGTISFGSRFWKVGGSPDAKVTVCLIPEVKFLVVQDEQKIGEYCL